MPRTQILPTRPHGPHFSPRALCAAALGVALMATGCSRDAPTPVGGPATPPEDAPALVLLVVVDQFRADYLERFRPLFTGGLAQLLDEGVAFTDSHHFHAETVTAAGHATISTGMLPRHHGVIGNSWYRRELDEEVMAVYDSEYGRSPRALETPTLGDTLKLLYPQSKVFGIGGKDRSALFTSGLRADGAYFYDRSNGSFRTTSYFGEELPTWLQELNERDYTSRYFGKNWEPLLPIEELAPYDIEPLDWGFREDGFPHAVGSPSLFPNGSFYSAIYSTPFLDDYTVELAKALIEGERLGQDEWPDILAVNLAATDTIGHTFGPNSPELADTLMRVDRSLSALLSYVERTVGLDRTLVVLSSDHGVDPIPELLAAKGVPAHRMGAPEINCFQRAGAALTERFGPEEWLEYGLYFDRQLIAEKGLAFSDVKALVSETLSACPGVARVHDVEVLQQRDDLDPIEQLYYNSAHTDRAPDLIVQAQEHVLFSRSTAASHGSPYPYDTHVPWLMRLPDGRRGLVTERTHTIDIAPTIGHFLGLRLQGQVDGIDRSPLIDSAIPGIVETPGAGR